MLGGAIQWPPPAKIGLISHTWNNDNKHVEIMIMTLQRSQSIALHVVITYSVFAQYYCTILLCKWNLIFTHFCEREINNKLYCKMSSVDKRLLSLYTFEFVIFWNIVYYTLSVSAVQKAY